MKITRPMLAAAASNEDLEKLRYPLLASPKLDGIRCLILEGLGPVSRSFKPIANHHVRELLHQSLYYGLDGEIMVVDEEGKPLDFNQIQSAIMTRSGTPRIELWAFDYLFEGHEKQGYSTRMSILRKYLGPNDDLIKPLKQIKVTGPGDIRKLAQQCMDLGYEGIVLRDPQGVYKCGRSTLKQQGMIKFKDFADAEGIIVELEELQRNENPQEKDAFGLAERSSHKAGMRAGSTLGALVLETQWGRLRVGTGFDHALRDEIWSNPEKYIGKQVTFKYQTHGMQDLPRFPVFLRFREPE